MIEESGRRDEIAIIGLDAKIGSAGTKDEIWQAFFKGMDMITDFPAQRLKDAQQFAKYTAGHTPNRFGQKAYFPRIDQFDAGLFRIPPVEASAMSPAQRILTESVWSAIEDAGYGGDKLYGTKTGVYIGYNAISTEYQSLFQDASQEVLGVSVSGNVSSYLASRISYLLNLSGPAMVIDTACSSSLVALHIACRALRNHEIDVAVAGSIRIYLCPEYMEGQNIGTESSSQRTKTFDESADGTGGGEGVISLILKPLEDALSSNDHIYGIIKGSSVNQNGASIGITAPNSASQEEVIVNAWNDAHIDPEKISYIEAHGTATKLGDPVEIGGITGAFKRVTDKKQFCAVGAAKSNFGHLDCASGLLGIVKVILMMENHWIPPTVHFYSPNRKINYIESPVYVNDRGMEWITEDGILLAGISSFGISGTNCHVILQSPPEVKSDRQEIAKKNILTASAMEKESLNKILISYKKYLGNNPDVDFESFCYTANTGRGQYRYRFASVLDNAEQFINMTESEMMSDEHCSSCEGNGDEFMYSPKNTTELSLIAENYLKGKKVDFSKLYDESYVRKLSIPAYPFMHKRYWYEPKLLDTKKLTSGFAEKDERLHALIDRCCIDSYNLQVYEKIISVDTCSELRAHKINDLCVMPGTVYVEIAYLISQRLYKDIQVNFKNITFFTPMTCRNDEERLLHIIVEINKSESHIKMLSKSKGSDEWVMHAEAFISPQKNYRQNEKISIDSLLAEFEPYEIDMKSDQSNDAFVKVGEQWDNVRNVYKKGDSLLVKIEVREKYEDELSEYHLYPYVLDASVNSGNALLNEVHLPLNYEDMVIWKDISKTTYSYIKKIPVYSENEEVAMFNVKLYDGCGEQVGEIKKYTLKLVNNKNSFLEKNKISDDAFYHIQWIEKKTSYDIQENIKLPYTVIMCTKEQLSSDIVSEIKNSSIRSEIICLSDDKSDEEVSQFHVCSSDEEIYQILNKFESDEKLTVISLIPYSSDKDIAQMEQKLKNTFNTAKAICRYADINKVCFVAIALNAGSINGKEIEINPVNQAAVGFYSCIGMEQNKIDVCIIDTDSDTRFELLLREITGSRSKVITGYRNNCRYIKKLKHFQAYGNAVTPENGDIIVIAGGFGGIGLTISEYLLNQLPDTKIILLSREGIKDENDVRTHKLRKIQSEGHSVDVIKADISDDQQTVAALEQVRRKYGHIDGVILAAGVAGDGMLINKSWNKAWSVLKPKILGANILDAATQNDSLKYFIMFSSFASVFGAPGQTDYTAANAFLDSFAIARTRLGKNTVTINWTGWKETGMAYNYNVNSGKSLFKFVTNDEGVYMFERALKIGFPQILTGEFMKDNLNENIDELQKKVELPENITADAKFESENTINADDIIITGKFSEELTEVERNVALAWARTLGINEINIYDKFFEIGGSSLLAAYLQKEVEKFYPGVLAIADTFIYSTISEMSDYISRKTGARIIEAEETIKESSDVESLVQQFMNGELDIDELGKMI
jgi:beta-ketoacyl synthase